jgi:hypothetical protein
MTGDQQKATSPLRDYRGTRFHAVPAIWRTTVIPRRPTPHPTKPWTTTLLACDRSWLIGREGPESSHTPDAETDAPTKAAIHVLSTTPHH